MEPTNNGVHGEQRRTYEERHQQDYGKEDDVSCSVTFATSTSTLAMCPPSRERSPMPIVSHRNEAAAFAT